MGQSVTNKRARTKLKRDLRNWLDETLRARPQSVAVPDQKLRGRSYRKVCDELMSAGYHRYGGYVFNDDWIFELPHPARETRDSFHLNPFSLFDRRWSWNPATQSLHLDGPWMTAYSHLHLRTTLDDPQSKSYCRPSYSGISAAEIEALHRVRYFEDTDEHPIFGRYALVDPAEDGYSPNPKWCLVEASSAELIRDASPLIKRKLDDGTQFVIRPMQGYWFIRTFDDDCKRLMTKFGLLDTREAISSGELSPGEAWAFELCEAWFQAHPGQTTIGPIDSEEAYSQGYLGRPTHGFAKFGKRVAQLVAEGPPKN